MSNRTKRRNKPWTDDDYRILREMLSVAATLPEIGRMLQRTQTEVASIVHSFRSVR